MRTDVYLPSNVEWVTCLEMERDVRKMTRETQFGAGPYTLPKVNPAINEGRTVSAEVLEAQNVRWLLFFERPFQFALATMEIRASWCS